MHALVSLAIIAVRLEFAASSEQITEYWIELELLAVHWKRACLTTGGCANPRFKISKSSKFSAEIISVSWAITESFVERVDGEYRGVAEEEMSVSGRPGKLIVEVRAKCFNATFAVQKFTKREAWCPKQDAIALIGPASECGVSEKDSAVAIATEQEFTRVLTGDPSVLIILAGMLMISLLGLGCLLIVISKQRRSISMLRKRSPVQPPTHATAYLFAEQLTKSDKKADDRYSIPWDQKCSLHPCWMFNGNARGSFIKSTVVGASALNRSSVPTLIPPRITTIAGTISNTSKRLSPNSSLSERREDSGLESV